MPSTETASTGLLAIQERLAAGPRKSLLLRDAELRTARRLEFDAAPMDALFDDIVTAVVLNTNPSTLVLWRLAKRGPSWIRVGRAVKYSKRDLLAFIGENRHEPRE